MNFKLIYPFPDKCLSCLFAYLIIPIQEGCASFVSFPTNQFTFETARQCNHNMLLLKITAGVMLPVRDDTTQVGRFTPIQLIITDIKLITCG